MNCARGVSWAMSASSRTPLFCAEAPCLPSSATEPPLFCQRTPSVSAERDVSQTALYGPRQRQRGVRGQFQLGPAPMERRNHGSFDASKSLQWMGDGGVGIVDGVVASLFLS
jgi:hypothetical protein